MSTIVKAGLAIGAIILLILAITWLAGKRNEGERVIVPPATQARADSLDATRADRDQARDSATRMTDSVIVLAWKLRDATRPARATATGAGITADSAAILARRAETARDSAIAWQAAYVARTKQVEALETVVAGLDSAAVQDSIAIATVRRSWALDVERLALETQTRQELQAAISRANECRILWVVDCPTRTQAAIGGAILTFVAVKYGDDLVRAVKP